MKEYEKKVSAVIAVNNMPDTYDAEANPFVVATPSDGELWYYGAYGTDSRAHSVISELGDGIVLDIHQVLG